VISSQPPRLHSETSETLDRSGAADHDQPYRFGRRPRSSAPSRSAPVSSPDSSSCAAAFRPASSEEVTKQFEAVKNDYVRGHNPEPWSAALVNCQLTESDIKNHIALELSQLRLVDAHLRPTVQVDAAAVEAYYKDHFSPQAGGQPVSLQEAAPRIRELLTQEKINQLLISWLDSLHSQAKIRILAPGLSETEGQGQ